jgi:SOS-response transcriptional repressor LexA
MGLNIIKQYSLTKRQGEVLHMIVHYRAEHGIAPSLREIMAALNIKSLGHVSGLLSALEERGYIQRLARRGRSIVVLTTDTTETGILKAIRDAAIAYIAAQARFRPLYEADMASEDTKAAGALLGSTLERLKGLVRDE